MTAVVPTQQAIQALRALAACMVLGYHACVFANSVAGYAIPINNAGAAGVDLFFIISGFIITYVTGTHIHPIEFWVRRLIRIAPLYWFYTLIMVGLLVLVPKAFAQLQFSWRYLVYSWCFILSENNAGSIGTLLGVGWTLCYEAYFYAVFGLMLYLPQRYRFIGLGGLILTGTLLQMLIQPAAFATVAVSSLPLEFLAGCLLARAYQRQWHLPTAAAIIALVAGLLALFVAGQHNWVQHQQSGHRVLYFGLPCLAIAAGVIALEVRHALAIPRWLLAIGAASYSLYLSHQFILVVLAKIWQLAGLTALLPAPVFVVFMLVSISALALVAYRCTEAPITRALIALWHRARPAFLRAHTPAKPFLAH